MKPWGTIGDANAATRFPARRAGGGQRSGRIQDGWATTAGPRLNLARPSAIVTLRLRSPTKIMVLQLALSGLSRGEPASQA